MSAVLTVGDETIDLGNPIRLLGIFAEMERACGDAYEEFADLFGVPDATMEDEEVAPEWLADVRAQADGFIERFGSGLGEDAIGVLTILAERPTRYAAAQPETSPTIYAAAYHGPHSPPTFTPLGDEDTVSRFVDWCRTQDAAESVQQFGIDHSTNPVGGREDVERYAAQLGDALSRVTDEGVGGSIKAVGRAVLVACEGAEGVALTEKDHV